MNRSRLLPRLVAALPVAVLVLGCQSRGQIPFKYIPESPTKVSPAIVEINSNCEVKPERALKEYPERAVVKVELINWWNPRAQVLWHVVDMQKGDRVVISGGPAKLRDKEGHLGRQIPGVFQGKYEILESDVAADAIRSGVPKHILELLKHKDESVVWEYQVDYYRDGKPLCTKDPPDICVEKVGSTGCITG